MRLFLPCTSPGLTTAENDEPVQIAFWQLLTAGILGRLWCLPKTPVQTNKCKRPACFMQRFSTGVCIFAGLGQKYVRASQAGVILSAEGFGALFSLILGLESFRFTMLLGGLLITLSIILAQRPEKSEQANQAA